MPGKRRNDTGKEFITIKLTQQEAYDLLMQIPQLRKSQEEALLLIKGDEEKNIKGLINHVVETNGKVKWHTKLLFAAFAFAMFILSLVINHLANSIPIN